MNNDAPTQGLGWSRPLVGLAIVVAILGLLAGGFGASFEPKLSEVQQNDNSAWLPRSAESTKVDQEFSRFVQVQTFPGYVVFHRPPGADGKPTPLTDADKAEILQLMPKLAAVDGVDASGVHGAVSDSGSTILVSVPLVGKQGDHTRTSDEIAAAEKSVMDIAKAGFSGNDAVQVYPAGPGGLFSAFIDALAGIDGVLLFVAFGVVILILLFVYRSPVLWIFPILSAVLAIGIASMIVYALAKADVVTVNGQTQGILFVLIIGAGTDYALLLISRYREELHRYPNRFRAMLVAWRESAGAIIASAATVIVGLLCLSFSELGSNRGLGPVAAIGIACTLLIMMTFLPIVLAAAGRWVFWPARPGVDQAGELQTHGMWGRIANTVLGHHRLAWVGSTLVLLIGCLGLGALKTDGLTMDQQFTNNPPAVAGQRILDAEFGFGTGAVALISVNADAADTVMHAVAGVPGVATGPGAVCVQPDLNEVMKHAPVALVPASTLVSTGCLPGVKPIDGRIILNANLSDAFDSPAAIATIERMRDAVHAIPGANALVGGSTAATLDTRDAAVHDRNLVMPIVLAVIFLVLVLLLRALLVPVLLIASVVLSFAAALGVSGFMFTHVFGFAGADQSFPLFAFVFLVALGIDYNIFLMTRVREESLRHGTREGIRRGLSVTGGVITSAGAVLAATFAMLSVLPIVAFAEVGFAVAFGVLLDTIIVRSILVPALAHDLGRVIWWPSALSKRTVPPSRL